ATAFRLSGKSENLSLCALYYGLCALVKRCYLSRNTVCFIDFVSERMRQKGFASIAGQTGRLFPEAAR
ncbi:MAG: hypothetical protein OSJ58_06505, partial [Dysosmobacter sp.]|nr:hypothetical protein [Dysosmobacter sp.]